MATAKDVELVELRSVRFDHRKACCRMLVELSRVRFDHRKTCTRLVDLWIDHRNACRRLVEVRSVGLTTARRVGGLQ